MCVDFDLNNGLKL